MARFVDKEVDFATKKKELEKNNTSVRRPIERLNRDIVPSRTGRKRKYTPTRLMNNINKYFEWCENNDELPTISGMMIHLKLYRDRFYSYAEDPRYRNIMEQARLVIKNWAEVDVYNTKGMAAGKIAFMKNTHGWADKLDQSSTNLNVEMTPEDARRKIESLAPRLLEALQSSEVVKQLVQVEEAEVVKEETNG